jgi:hypothetical protein
MNEKEHLKRHQLLHKELDELIADFIQETGKLPSKTTLMELITWSHEQTIKPTKIKNGK